MSMHNLNRLIFFLVVFFSISMLPSALCQSVRWSQPMADNSKYGYLKIIGSDGDGFYVLRSNLSLSSTKDRSGFKSRKYLLQYYGMELNLHWEQELTAPAEGGKIADVQVMDDKVIVLFYTRDKASKKFNFYVQFINASGKWQDQAVLLDDFSADEFDEENKPGIMLSHDQTKFAMSYRKFQKDQEVQAFMVVVADNTLRILYR